MGRESVSGEPPVHSTRVSDQPALNTSTGLVWLLIGGLLTAVGVVVLLAMATIDPVLAWSSLIAILVLYATMLVIRVAVRPQRVRLFLLAALFLLITVIELVCVLIVASMQSAAIR